MVRKVPACLLGLTATVLVLAAPNSSARAPQQPSPAAVQSEPLPPTPTLLRKIVTFLTVDVHDGLKAIPVRGTAFFVAYEDKRIGPDGGFVYLVTNRHVAEPRDLQGHMLPIDRVSLRLNYKSTTQ